MTKDGFVASTTSRRCLRLWRLQTATSSACTSKWGVCYKALLDHFGNISMTLTHPHDYLDLDKMLQDPKHPVPAFDGNPEACSGACWEWYKEYRGVRGFNLTR